MVLIVVAVPSRTGIPDYQQLRDRLEQLVGRINGEYGAIGYMPIWYLYRNMPFEKLTALYSAADVAMVTPLRDGMNLIAKEFVATKADGRGVLILSETTGAASELGEALIVNPHDKAAIVEAIKRCVGDAAGGATGTKSDDAGETAAIRYFPLGRGLPVGAGGSQGQAAGNGSAQAVRGYPGNALCRIRPEVPGGCFCWTMTARSWAFSPGRSRRSRTARSWDSWSI